MIGETISRYRVESRLGSGGMGDVYRAEDLRLRRPVALKILRPDALGAPVAERVLEEARAASALSHPNIAVIYEVDEAEVAGERIAFIAMEYVAGRTLKELAAADELTVTAVLDVGRQVAEALAAAHDRGLVHRDITPSNIMMTDAGLVKVLDFGVAFRRPAATVTADATTRTGDVLSADGFVGTLPYVAPEQATAREVDGRADMFALGVVLYELLSGAPPFRGGNLLQTFESLIRDEPPPLIARSDDARLTRIEPIVRRMLAKDRGARYANLHDVARLLADAERLEDLTVGVASAAADSVAVMGFTNITGSAEDEWLGTGMSETLTADLTRSEGVTVIGRERVHEMLRTLEARLPERGAGLFLRAGRELGVRWILNGGFQRTGEAIRVTASLTDVNSGHIVRTIKVDGRLSAIFDVQDRIVSELREGLRAATSGVEASRGTTLVDAYEAFSKGVVNLRVESYETLDRATIFFEQAVRIDPSYARAHIELGSAYATKADYLALPNLRELALTHQRRALELDPRSVRAWRDLGATLVNMGKVADGEEAIRRALAIDPHDAGALGARARALFIGRGQFKEAADCYDAALAQNPKGGWYALQLAHCAALTRDFARGEAAARRAIDLQEGFLSGGDGVVVVGAYMRHGHLEALQLRHQEAVESFQRELDFLGRVDHALRNRTLVELNMRLGAAFLSLGRERKAQAAFEVALEGFERRLRLGADDPYTRYYAAGVHALRGEVEIALAFLERAASERPLLTRARARIEPEFERLRNDPRLTRVLEES